MFISPQLFLNYAICLSQKISMVPAKRHGCKEFSGFFVPTGTNGYLQMKDFPGLYAPNYQDPILKAPAGSPSHENGFVLPGLFELSDGESWLMVHEAETQDGRI